jgi:hypothetical protein
VAGWITDRQRLQARHYEQIKRLRSVAIQSDMRASLAEKWLSDLEKYPPATH